MKRTLIFLSMLVMVLSLQDTQAQSLRSMIKKKILEDNLEAQAKRDSARAVEEGEEPDQSPNTTMNHVYMDALGLSGNVDYETSYDFDAYIQMEVSEYKKNEKLNDHMVYDSYITKDAVDYAMVFKDDNSKSTIIFDSKNNAMLMLTDSDGEHTGIAMGMDPETLAEEAEEYEEESNLDSYKPYKTGKTKTILGYSCDEYLVDDETSEVHMWVSEKLGKQVRREMLSNQQTFGAIFYHAAYMDGMVLEYDFLDKENGERSVMLVTDLDLNHSHSISTRSYAMITMKGQSPEE
ncbi:MAG: DUF4412 domain-containing protein [Bacteroidota bacterium]